MVNNILIISSNYTGHGHKSITDSLCEQFEKYDNVNVHVVDGFSMGGNVGLRVGKMYGSVTRNAKELWKLMWELSLKKPHLANEFLEFLIKESFLKLLKSIKPDLILSVHPNFNGSVLNILEEYNINIPFVTLIADLVSITPLWADSRANYIICPSKESMFKSLEFGVPQSKLKLFGFPVRSKFYKHIDDKNITEEDYNINKPLRCLVMSGGEGVGNMSTIAKILLKNFNCEIKIVAGRNKILKRRLEYSFSGKFAEKVKVYGFVSDIQELMLTSDIAFTRGSPNVMMECVNCNIPLIVTNALPGQEEGNPAYLEKYNLGVVCKDMRKLRSAVTRLLENNAEKLNLIKKSQKEFRHPSAAKDIVDFILGINKKTDTEFPDPISRFNAIDKTRTLMTKLRDTRLSLDKIKSLDRIRHK